MNDDFLCPRLIDYLAIIGLRDGVKGSRHRIVTPELLRRYPSTDHENGILPNDVVYFCQPDGCMDSCGVKIGNGELSQFFVFNLTDKETGSVRLGMCLNFFRPIDRRSPVRSPKKVSAPKQSDPSSRPLGSTSSTELPNKNSKLDAKRVKKRNKPRSHSLTSLLILSHHPFFRSFHHCLLILKDIIEAVDAKAKRRNNGKDSIWPALLGFKTESTNSVLHHDVVEIETWIFKLLSAPVPVPGITRVEVNLLPDMVPLVFALPDNDRLALVDFPLHSIFEHVEVEFAIKLLLAVILENKVVLQSACYGTLYTTILAIKTLLYPLEYMFPLTILLPTTMPDAEQLFMVPSPFVFGVPSTFLSTRKNYHIPMNIMYFDLDKKKLIRSDSQGNYSEAKVDEYLSLPPASDFNALVKHIKQNKETLSQALMSISDYSQPIRNFDEIQSNKSVASVNSTRTATVSSTKTKPAAPVPAAVTSNLSDYNPLIYGNDADSVDVSTRVAMIQFLTSPSILGNINKFTRILKLYPKPIVALQRSNFLKSRKQCTEFIKKLTCTQAILSFCEWNVAPRNRVFYEILSDKSDPRIIGDKPKWYQKNLETVKFQLYRNNGSCTLHRYLNCDSIINSDTPTDESGSDSDEMSTSSHSSAVEAPIEQHSDFADSGNSSTTPPIKCHADYQHFTVDPSSVYHPPTYLQIPNIGVILDRKQLPPVATTVPTAVPVPASAHESNSVTASNSSKIEPNMSAPPLLHPVSSAHNSSARYLSDSEEVYLKMKEQRRKSQLSHPSPNNRLEEMRRSEGDIANMTDSSVGMKSFDENSSFFNLVAETRSKLQNFFGGTSGGKLNSPTTKLPLSPNKAKSNFKLTGSQHSVVQHNDLTNKIRLHHRHGSIASSSSVKKDSDSISKDQWEELNRISDEIVNKRSINVIQQLRLKSMLENEECRNFVLSKINSNISRNVTNKRTDSTESEEFIEDVQVKDDRQFATLVLVCGLMIDGIQRSYRTCNPDGLGSVFVLLEMMHTHYLDVSDPNATNISLPPSSSPSPSNSEYKSGTIVDSICLNINGELYENIEIKDRINPDVYDHRAQASPNQSQPPELSTSPNDQKLSSPNNNLDNNENYPPIFGASTSVRYFRDSHNNNNNHSNLSSPAIRPTSLGLRSPDNSNLPSTLYDFSFNPKGADTRGIRYRLDRRIITKPPKLPGEEQDEVESNLRRGSRKFFRELISPSSIVGGFNTARSVVGGGSPKRYDTSNSATASQTNGRVGGAASVQLGDSSGSTFYGTSSHNVVAPALMGKRRLYLYEKLFNRRLYAKESWSIFWEDIFYDAVCQEREIIGLDMNAPDLLDRYNGLDGVSKQNLERTEDQLLGIMLNNLVGFMVMMRVPEKDIRSKANSMLGKSHLGLDESSYINRLMDNLEHLRGNAIDLRVNLSRRLNCQKFSAKLFYNTGNVGSTLQSPLINFDSPPPSIEVTLELYADCVLLRSVTGRIIHRWWFERIKNCSVKRNYVTISVLEGHEIVITTFRCKKSKQLVQAFRSTMSSLSKYANASSNIYHALDEVTKCVGDLEVCDQGIKFHTDKTSWSVDFRYVRKCCTKNPDKFVIEIIDPNTNNTTYRIFKSNEFDKIAYAILTQFSKMAASIAATSSAANVAASVTAAVA